MTEYSDKWKKSFEKKYSKALSQIRDLEKEYQEMKDSNPDVWNLVDLKEQYPESSDLPNRKFC